MINRDIQSVREYSKVHEHEHFCCRIPEFEKKITKKKNCVVTFKRKKHCG